mmetsp:Transcript_49682/g.106152  ORF Transcript_49682/g.106152 Transcript_49682/m.106152 type:complete len:230 (-) Transcript_49682:426-1115(-)
MGSLRRLPARGIVPSSAAQRASACFLQRSSSVERTFSQVAAGRSSYTVPRQQGRGSPASPAARRIWPWIVPSSSSSPYLRVPAGEGVCAGYGCGRACRCVCAVVHGRLRLQRLSMWHGGLAWRAATHTHALRLRTHTILVCHAQRMWRRLAVGVAARPRTNGDLGAVACEQAEEVVPCARQVAVLQRMRVAPVRLDVRRTVRARVRKLPAAQRRPALFWVCLAHTRVIE